MKRFIGCASATMLLLLLAPADLASAARPLPGVEITPNTAAAGSYAEITFRVPTRDLLGDPGRVPVGGEEELAPETEPEADAEPLAETPEDLPE